MNASSQTASPFRVLLPGDPAPPAGPGVLDLRLDGSAFGGGTHPTTRACLARLAALAPLDGRSVLDLGSGTGILGIAALLLGAARALCVDVNPEAVACARRNGTANGVDDRLAHRCGTVEDLAGARFDLVVANIGGELLLDEAPRIAPLLLPGGRLLLSGLLRDHAEELAATYEALGLRLLERDLPERFCALLMERS